jgi:hypothetical protein
LFQQQHQFAVRHVVERRFRIGAENHLNRDINSTICILRRRKQKIQFE